MSRFAMFHDVQGRPVAVDRGRVVWVQDEGEQTDGLFTIHMEGGQQVTVVGRSLTAVVDEIRFAVLPEPPAVKDAVKE